MLPDEAVEGVHTVVTQCAVPAQRSFWRGGTTEQELLQSETVAVDAGEDGAGEQAQQRVVLGQNELVDGEDDACRGVEELFIGDGCQLGVGRHNADERVAVVERKCVGDGAESSVSGGRKCVERVGLTRLERCCQNHASCSQ